MANQLHLTFDQRCDIEIGLSQALSFRRIAEKLNKDPSTISKEVRCHRIFVQSGAYGHPFNSCVHRFHCQISGACSTCYSTKRQYCRFCHHGCNSHCSSFQPDHCKKLSSPPYVCNGCPSKRKCTLEKSYYRAKDAQNEYESVRSESRQGVSLVPEEVLHLDAVISPLIQKGQSIHHIFSNNKDSIMCCEKTLYNYVDSSLLSAKNIDLPRKVRFRPRRKTSQHKVDRSCRIGRSYDDYISFTNQFPDTSVVQMDTVEGVKGGKVLFTIHFTQAELMLAFLRDSNDSKSVIDTFNSLYLILGHNFFSRLFPLLLTDNGSEFSNPSAIEFDPSGILRTRVFYCDPLASFQKGSIEHNHELIRRFVPKGHSFNSLSQADILLMMSHINSYSRKKLDDHSPFDVFSFLHGSETLHSFGITRISPNDIILNPSIFK